jgi:hypothetical protein
MDSAVHGLQVSLEQFVTMAWNTTLDRHAGEAHDSLLDMRAHKLHRCTIRNL